MPRVIATILHVHLAKISKIVRSDQLLARLSHPLHVENLLRLTFSSLFSSSRRRCEILSHDSREMILVPPTRTIKPRTESIRHRVPTQRSHVVRQRSIQITDVINLLSVFTVFVVFFVFSAAAAANPFTPHVQTHHVPNRTHPAVGPPTPTVIHGRFPENLLRWVHQSAFFQSLEQSAFDRSNVTVVLRIRSVLGGGLHAALTGKPEMVCTAIREFERNLARFIFREIERPLYLYLFGPLQRQTFLLLLLLLRRHLRVGVILVHFT